MKNKFTIRKHFLKFGVMGFLMITAIVTAMKISNDYQKTEVYSKEIEEVTVAGEAVSPTATPTVTPTPTVAVSGTAVGVKLDYDEQTIRVSAGSGGSSKFYFSADKKKTWNLIEQKDSKGLYLDLAVFLKTSANTLYFKGDKDKAVVEVVIPKEEKTLKISYYVQKLNDNGQPKYVGQLKIENATGALEYRKGTNGDWDDYKGSLDLSSYEITGYTLQFRVKATTTTRASKIVNVKIPKRQSAPSLKVDYSKLVISGLKEGVTQYRIGNGNWTDFKPTDSKDKSLTLAELLQPSGTAPNTAIPTGIIEFRALGTEKKAPSGIIAIEINAQPSAPLESNIKLNGTTFSITDASRTKPYEYLVLHAGETVNLEKARWIKVTSSKDIQIKKVGTAIPVPTDKIYIRLASTTDSVTKFVTPASTYITKEITSISLP